MFRRTFVKSLMAACSLPIWPFPKIKEKLNNSDFIKRLLKENKNFSIHCEHGLSCNIIRRKRKSGSKLLSDFESCLEDNLKKYNKNSVDDHTTNSINVKKNRKIRKERKQRWYKIGLKSSDK